MTTAAKCGPNCAEKGRAWHFVSSKKVPSHDLARANSNVGSISYVVLSTYPTYQKGASIRLHAFPHSGPREQSSKPKPIQGYLKDHIFSSGTLPSIFPAYLKQIVPVGYLRRISSLPSNSSPPVAAEDPSAPRAYCQILRQKLLKPSAEPPGFRSIRGP